MTDKSDTEPSQTQLRAELEAMVPDDLLGPAGGEGKVLTERSAWDRYLVDVLAPSRFADVAAGPAKQDATLFEVEDDA